MLEYKKENYNYDVRLTEKTKFIFKFINQSLLFYKGLEIS